LSGVRYTVPAPVSLGECLGRLLAEASRRTRKQMLAGRRVRVNGVTVRQADTALAVGDVVEVGPKESRAVQPPALEVVYEDDDVIVVDKPPGLLTIATEHERRRTLYAHLTARARTRKPPGRVFIVHRLDRLASGLLVFAASPVAKRTLQAQFAAHTVERTYLAVIEGRPAGASGTMTSRLLDDAPGRVRETRDVERGRAAVTHWRVARAGVRYSLLEVRLETGRRNQIRVHLAGLGHPIAGDATYGSRTDPLGRLALHAHVLGFDHPVTGARMRFVSLAPKPFVRLQV
jgi:23S rRNA pseudouridine1911/1915/1917 synthase